MGVELLIYEPSFQALSGELSQLSGLTPVRLQPGGGFLRGDGPVAVQDLAFEIAWADSHLYLAPALRDFMIACLKSTTLKWLQSSAAGFDHPVFATLVDKGVALSNSHAAAVPIAEFVLGAVLDHFNPQALRRQLQADRKWQPVRFRELSGSTWLIIGIGHIGSEIALRARAFGANVIGVRRTPTGDEPADRVITPQGVAAELPNADVVVLAAPANSDSQHLVDATFLAAMAPHSVLVNIGRGSLVDEVALLSALDRGVPECAILDVFETEPLPAESPLWQHPRVRLSAHNAPNSDGFVARNQRVLLDNLKRYLAGEQPEGIVAPETVKR